jgi:CRISPR/Cas system-associated protein Csm6
VLHCVSAKSIHDLELDFGYVVETSMCRFCAKICTKFLKEYFYMNYLVILSNLPR